MTPFRYLPPDHPAPAPLRLVAPRRILSALLAVAAVLCLCTVSSASGVEEIRVGYYGSPGFQEGDSPDAAKGGYAYEYLRRLSEYGGWKYTYVYGDWSDLYGMLLEGRIDVLAGVTPTKERAGRMLFPSREMGREAYILFGHAGDGSLAPSSPAALSGKRIGCIEDNLMTTCLESWLREQGVSASLVRFRSFRERNEAFSDGRVDAVVGTDNDDLSGNGGIPVFKIGEGPYHLAVAAGRPDLLGKIDAAIGKVLEDSPAFLANLGERYFAHAGVSRILSEDELGWLGSHPTLTVGYLEDYLPYSATDSRGEARGIVSELFPAMLRELGVEGRTSPRYVAFQSYGELVSALARGSIDAAFPVGGSAWQMEGDGILASAPVVRTAIGIVFRKGELADQRKGVIAVNANNTMQLRYVAKHFPDARTLSCESTRECLDAVLDGRADATVVNGLRVGGILGNSRYTSLTHAVLPGYDLRRVGVAPKEIGLLRLVNRGVLRLGPEYSLNASYRGPGNPIPYSAEDFIREHLTAILFGAAVLLLIGLLLFLHMRSERSHREELADTLARMERDAHTGVYSLQAFLGRSGDYLLSHASDDMDVVLLTVRHSVALRRQYGDETMRRLVRLIASDVEDLSGGDALTGLYGDDIVVSLAPHRDDADSAVRNLNAKISKELHVDDVHLAIGSYAHVDRSLPVEVMCARARMALEAAVGDPSGYVVRYTDEMERRILEETALENAFSEALVGGQFDIWFQPKCSPSNGRIVGAEALVRWRRGGELIGPARFIPCFERSGKIRALDRHVFVRTCSMVARWQAAGLTCVPVSVNLSRRTMRDGDIADFFLGIARRCGLRPELLPVEITETAAEDENAVRALGMRLREAGFPLHMDDFGSGASSLAHLSGSLFETIKLDRSLVEKVGTEDGDHMVRHATIMARAMGLGIVAEGVGTEAQAEFLRDVGVDALQGYYFSRPVPAADFEAMLAADAPLRKVDPGLDTYRTLSMQDLLDSLGDRTMGDRTIRNLAGPVGRCVLHDGQVVLKRSTPSALEVLGISADEVQERSARDLVRIVVPEEREAMLAFFRQLPSDEPGQASFRLQRSSGQVLVRIGALRTSNAPGCEEFSVRFSRERLPREEEMPPAEPQGEPGAASKEDGGTARRGVGMGWLHGMGVAAALLLAVVTVVELSSYAARYGEVRSLYERYDVLRTASTDLHEASAMLTESSRLFVQTRDRRHMDAYFHEANEVRRRERAVETMRSLLGDGPALDELRSALGESVALMGTEYRAMRLACEATGIACGRMPEDVAGTPLTPSDSALPAADKLRIASELLCGPDYLGTRISIDSRARRCLDAVRQGIDGRIRGLQGSLAKAMRRIVVEVLLLFVLLAVLSGTLFSMVLRPLRRMRDAVACGVASPVEGSGEMRMLAGTYNSLLRERLEAQRRLRHEAEHDALTGVLNRGAFTKLLEVYESGQEPFALILVDVDLFKRVNDTEGHEAGDRVLKRVADAIEKTFRGCDFTFRFGGDEFCVIMVNMTRDLDRVVMEKVARINAKVAEPMPGVPGVTLSVGVAFSETTGPDETLLGNADRALYRVKERGRNGCAVFTRGIDDGDA